MWGLGGSLVSSTCANVWLAHLASKNVTIRSNSVGHLCWTLDTEPLTRMISARVKNSLFEIGLLGCCLRGNCQCACLTPQAGVYPGITNGDCGFGSSFSHRFSAFPWDIRNLHEFVTIYGSACPTVQPCLTVAQCGTCCSTWFCQVETLIGHGQAGHELRVPGRKSDISEKLQHMGWISKRLGKLFCDYLSFPNFWVWLFSV